MVQMQHGQEYELRNGAKMTQRKAAQMFGAYQWLGSDGVWRSNDGKSSTLNMPHDIIAEWPSELEGKTLAELDVKPGDVVRVKSATGNQEISHQDERGRWFSDSGCLRDEAIWAIVSRASDKDTADTKPTNWGAWVLRDPDIAWDNYPVDGPVKLSKDEDGNVVAYCIPMPPVKGTVTRYGSRGPKGDWAFGGNLSKGDTHKQTFVEVDGNPDCASITMEELTDA